jgi:hypothetical protein
MTILTLLMSALIGVILVSAVVGTRPETRGRWTALRRRFSISRHGAMGGVDSAGVGNWENEGGSIAIPDEAGAPAGAGLGHAPRR